MKKASKKIAMAVMCKHHKPKNKIMGYMEWDIWATKQIKSGKRQKQCPKCGFYLFPEEMGKK